MEAPHEVGKIRELQNGRKQLLLHIRAKTQQGRPLTLRALVDNGAEANLIRKGLLPPHIMQISKNPLALVTADGTRMDGGSREVTLKLTFKLDQPDQTGNVEWSTTGTFHDADIQVDAILSYPWLEQSKLGVFPHLGSLVRLPPPGEPCDPTLLKGWNKQKKRKRGGPKLDKHVPTNKPRRFSWSKRLSTLAKKCKEDQELLATIAKGRSMQLSVPERRRTPFSKMRKSSSIWLSTSRRASQMPCGV